MAASGRCVEIVLSGDGVTYSSSITVQQYYSSSITVQQYFSSSITIQQYYSSSIAVQGTRKKQTNSMGIAA